MYIPQIPDPPEPVVMIFGTGEGIGGQNLTLQCLLIASSNSTNYIWQKINESSGLFNSISSGDDGEDAVATSDVLELSQLNISNSGEYQCSVTAVLSNGLSFIGAATANVTVTSMQHN